MDAADQEQLQIDGGAELSRRGRSTLHEIPGDCSTERKLALRVEGLLEKHRLREARRVGMACYGDGIRRKSALAITQGFG